MKTNLRLILMLAIMSGAACSQNQHRNNPNNTPNNTPNNPVVAISHLSGGYFPSIIEAVITASNRYNPRSITEDREYMGAVLRNGMTYRYTVAQGQMGSDSINLRLVIPKGMEVVAFWHTHGEQHFSRKYFSDIDSALVKRWNKPFYLANHTGNLRVLKPGDHTLSTLQAARLGLGKSNGYAKGKRVLGNYGSPVRIATSEIVATSVKPISSKLTRAQPVVSYERHAVFKKSDLKHPDMEKCNKPV